MTEAAQILLVEDNPADIDLTIDRMKSAKIANKLHVAEDGNQALAFLRKQPPFESAPTPDLILLDLNLPGTDGRAVLEALKSDSQLKFIPIVVLTSSAAEEDVLRSYELHANAYIQKPIDLDGYKEIVRSIDNFWLSLVKLPTRTSSGK